jgi:hypothetical protein
VIWLTGYSVEWTVSLVISSVGYVGIEKNISTAYRHNNIYVSCLKNETRQKLVSNFKLKSQQKNTFEESVPITQTTSMVVTNKLNLFIYSDPLLNCRIVCFADRASWYKSCK